MSNRARSASARVSSTGERSLVGLVGHSLHGLRRVHREERLPHEVLDVELLGRRPQPRHVDERVRRRGLRGDAPEIEELLVHARAHERRRVGLHRAHGDHRRATDARNVDERCAHVGARAVVGGRGEELGRGADRRIPLRARDTRRFALGGDARQRRPDGRLVLPRVSERVGQRHDPRRRGRGRGNIGEDLRGPAEQRRERRRRRQEPRKYTGKLHRGARLYRLRATDLGAPFCGWARVVVTRDPEEFRARVGDFSGQLPRPGPDPRRTSCGPLVA
jgi:hypothetical protein